MTKKIPNLKERLEYAIYDPLERLAEELYSEGVTEKELYENLNDLIVDDVVRVKLANYLRDKIRHTDRNYEYHNRKQKHKES